MEEVADRRAELYEMLADIDDDFAELYLSGDDISIADVKKTIRKAVIELKFTPILMGAAYRNKGVQQTLDAVGEYLPAPDEIQNNALDLDKEEAPVDLDPSPKKPLVALAFKLEENIFGQLTYMRLYQGKLKRGDTILNTRSEKKVKISRMVKMHSNEMEEL